ncbi:TIGR02147 family protein [Bacteriovoracaceae bacterium]|nr:TIGR02147 family protein [Bacteriovoracaceae bacterium]
MDKVYAFQTLLKKEFQSRLDRNPYYSQRAFALHLEMNNGTLSRLMNGKRSLSYKKAISISQILNFSVNRQKKFLLSIATHQAESGSKRKDKELSELYKFNQYKTKAKQTIQKYNEISQEHFKFISEWYHYAIMQMMEGKDFKLNYCWIASQLEISPTKVKMAIDRLIELGLVIKENQTLKRTQNHLEIIDKQLTSRAQKQRQSDILKLSQKSLDRDSLQLRNHSGVTMNIDPELIPEAKEKIESFLDELSDFLESGRKEKVYELTVNLFPLQKGSPS